MNTREQILDELLVLRAQAGEGRALQRLAERWHPRLVRRAFGLIGDVDGAQDVAQNAWLAVVRGIGRLQDPSRFGAWALRIVARRAVDWIRKVQRQRQRQDPLGDGQAAVLVSPEVVDREEPLAQLRVALDRLPADRQAILTMHHLDGLSVQAIAKVLAIPEGTVKSRLHHARKHLRSALEGDSP